MKLGKPVREEVVGILAKHTCGVFMYVLCILCIVLISLNNAQYVLLIYYINYRISRLYKQPHKYMSDTNYILKIIQTTFYQQKPHKYFNLIIFSENLIVQEVGNI